MFEFLFTGLAAAAADAVPAPVPAAAHPVVEVAAPALRVAVAKAKGRQRGKVLSAVERSEMCMATAPEGESVEKCRNDAHSSDGTGHRKRSLPQRFFNRK